MGTTVGAVIHDDSVQEEYMGVQQSLFLGLGVVIVGTAVAMAISFGGTQMDASVRDALLQDCLRLTGEARTYYTRPAYMGGGNGSFSAVDLEALGMHENSNLNGTFSVVGSEEECHIEATSMSNPGALVRVTLASDGSMKTTFEGWN